MPEAPHSATLPRMDLAALFSTIDSAKRQLGDALSNPGLYAQQIAGQITDAGRDYKAKLDAAMPDANPWAGGTPEARLDAINAVMAGPMGFAPAGMFVNGTAKGLENAGLYRHALEMRNKGAAPKEIWNETGWAQAPWDQRWRTEISDSASRPLLVQELHRPGLDLEPTGSMHGTGGGPFGQASEAFQHDKLFSAYPSLDKINLLARVEPESFWGVFNPAANGPRDQIVARGRTPEELRSVILHEMQHAVQKRAGFQQGGSPSMFEGWTADPQAQFKFYEALPGEAEARLTQARRNIGDSGRRAMFPYDPAYFESMTGTPMQSVLDMFQNLNRQ